MPSPYYSDDGVTLYHGDARELLPEVLQAHKPTVAITDPIWPNGQRAFPGVDAYALWGEVAPMLEGLDRLVVVLGCDSDPRFLGAVPGHMPFVRTCWLRYPGTSYKGNILIDSDVAFVFGKPFGNGDGTHRMLPSECQSRRGGRVATRCVDGKPVHAERATHPCPRHPDHMRWLAQNFTRKTDIIVDPFAGAGTTLTEAREMGRRAVGIEVDERWCAEAVSRLAQRNLFSMDAP